MRRRSRRSRTPRIPRKAVKKSHRKKFQKGGYQFENNSGKRVNLYKLNQLKYNSALASGNGDVTLTKEVNKREAHEAMAKAYGIDPQEPLYMLTPIFEGINHEDTKVEGNKGSLDSDLVIKIHPDEGNNGFMGQTITLSGNPAALQRSRGWAPDSRSRRGGADKSGKQGKKTKTRITPATKQISKLSGKEKQPRRGAMAPPSHPHRYLSERERSRNPEATRTPAKGVVAKRGKNVNPGAIYKGARAITEDSDELDTEAPDSPVS